MTVAVAHTPAPAHDKFVPVETPDSFEDGQQQQQSNSGSKGTASTVPPSSVLTKSGSVTRIRGVGLTDFEVTLAGTVGYLAIGTRMHGYLAAFRAIRPLVVQLLMLSPRKAYSTFKVFSRLQRLCQTPYLPDLTKGTVIDPTSNTADAELITRLSRYLKFAASVYPAEILMGHDLTSAIKLGKKAQVDQVVKSFYPKAKLLMSREKAEVKKPGFAMYSLECVKEIILTIQGSHTKSDWVTNIVCNPSEISGQHHGMKVAAMNLDVEIRDTLVTYLRNGRRDWKVTIVGHSLGGGTATLLAIRWINLLPEEYRHQVQAYSFGAPCVVSQKDAIRYKDQIYSIIYGRDIVSRLSFGTVRDLLVTLHGLSASWRVSGAGSLEDVHNTDNANNVFADDDDDEEDSESAASDAEVDLLDDEDDAIDIFGEHDEGASSETESTTSTSTPPIPSESYAPKMKGMDRRDLLRRDLTLVRLSLPIGFKELRRLVRQRAREMDERVNNIRVEPRKPGWFARLFRRNAAPKLTELSEKQVRAENMMLNDTLGRIMNIHESPENEMMMPAGSTILIVPKLHFLIAQKEPPVQPSKDGQCVLVRFEGKALVELLREPVWHADSIKDHSINCYFQGLDPLQLKSLPRHTAILSASQAAAQNKRKHAPVATAVSMKPGDLGSCCIKSTVTIKSIAA